MACCLLASATNSALAPTTPVPTVSPPPTMSTNIGGTTRMPTIGIQKLPSPPNRTNRPTEEETETDETLLSMFVRRGNHCGAPDVDVVLA